MDNSLVPESKCVKLTLENVLILVVMDNSLVHSPFLEQSYVTAQVLILVVMDNSLVLKKKYRIERNRNLS